MARRANPLAFGLIGLLLNGFGGALWGVAIAAFWNWLNGAAEKKAGGAPGGEQGDADAGAANTTPGDFAVSLMVLAAAVMKADGRATRSELEFVKKFLRENFSRDFTQHALDTLQELLKHDIPVSTVCPKMARALNASQRLQLFHLLVGIAWADGVFDPREESLLRQIAAGLRLRPNDVASVFAMHARAHSDSPRRDPESATNDDYAILGIPPSATDDEVRKAFRSMAMKHHPDKVAHLGPEFQRTANEKFTRINDAYQRIKKARGF